MYGVVCYMNMTVPSMVFRVNGILRRVVIVCGVCCVWHQILDCISFRGHKGVDLRSKVHMLGRHRYMFVKTVPYHRGCTSM